MVTEKMFVGGKDRQVAEVDKYISDSALNAFAEFERTEKRVIIR